MNTNNIVINPIGTVFSDIEKSFDMPVTGKLSSIRIYPEFVGALDSIQDNSHLWVLSWFHQADRTQLRTAPMKVNKDLPERGVFGLRCHSRPNPIGLSLVKLEKVETDILHVSGFDAIDGTPVIDIKPYYEQDIIFSPDTPYIRPKNMDMRREILIRIAENHHQEKCLWLQIGVKMAMIADDDFGCLQERDLKVQVTGPPCLADIIQGLTRARFSNPPRFEYICDPDSAEVAWDKNGKILITMISETLDEINSMTSDEIIKLDIVKKI